ncbi:UNVERIFIED_CONTAM: hypothetical protein NCL1_29638 [Trichonephila clavipes]
MHHTEQLDNAYLQLFKKLLFYAYIKNPIKIKLCQCAKPDFKKCKDICKTTFPLKLNLYDWKGYRILIYLADDEFVDLYNFLNSYSKLELIFIKTISAMGIFWRLTS